MSSTPRLSPAPAVIGVLFGLGVVVGGVAWQRGGHQPLRPPGEVPVANAVHVGLALLVAIALVVAARSDPDRLRRFLAWPFTIDGWRSLLSATVAVPLAIWQLVAVVAHGAKHQDEHGAKHQDEHGAKHQDERVRLPVAVVLLVAVVAVWYTPFRAGVQALAGLDPNFTSDAWGGPSYVGAALAHWLDGLLIFYAAATVVRVLTRSHAGADPSSDRRLDGIAS